MATWAEFETSKPTLAAAGQRLIYRTETGEALLATVRGDDPPRIHPIWVGIVGGRLYAFILKSAKRVDLQRDGRYALHSHIDPTGSRIGEFGGPRHGQSPQEALRRCLDED